MSATAGPERRQIASRVPGFGAFRCELPPEPHPATKTVTRTTASDTRTRESLVSPVEHGVREKRDGGHQCEDDQASHDREVEEAGLRHVNTSFRGVRSGRLA